MVAQYYTAIDELVKKHNEMRQVSGSVSKEFGIASTSSEISSLELPIEEEESCLLYTSPSPRDS